MRRGDDPVSPPDVARRDDMSRTAVVFCMPLRGHFQRLRPLIAGLVEAGVTTHVFTDRGFAAEVAQAGGTFVDLFAGRPLDAADASSMPIPCRYVSFAGVFADAVLADVARLRPQLVVHDTFAVIAWAIANRLAVPRVNVCAAHNTAPAPTVARLQRDPRVALAPACRTAAQVLRERWGIADAGPFSYVTGVSPDLNVYCEPPQFLRAEERAPFEPLAFFGSLAAADLAAAPVRPAVPRLYASFGTVIWTYYAGEALAALTAIADAVAARPDLSALISLGGWDRAPLAARLTRANVGVEGYVDQRQVLRASNAFITHHGLNSTHEAVANQVPMLSYPIFGDQPRMARRCQELGLALPLADAPRAPLTAARIHEALDALAAHRPRLDARLAAARAWEQAVVRARPAVIERVVALMQRA